MPGLGADQIEAERTHQRSAHRSGITQTSHVISGAIDAPPGAPGAGPCLSYPLPASSNENTSGEVTGNVRLMDAWVAENVALSWQVAYIRSWRLGLVCSLRLDAWERQAGHCLFFYAPGLDTYGSGT